MKYLFVFLVLGLASSVIGQIRKKEHHYHDNRQLAYEYSINEAGQRDGEQRDWHENGWLEKEYNFWLGKAHGLYREYNSDGSLWEEKTYNYGGLEGWYYKYDGDNISITGEYKAGKKIGIWRYYHYTVVNKGQKSKKEVYTETGDGVLISKKCWDKDGTVITCP